MLLILRWLLVALRAVILFRFRFRRLPVFCGYLLAMEIAWIPHIRLERWFGASWLRWWEFAAAARIAVGLEVLWLLTEGMDRRDRRSMVGFAACCGLMLAAAAWRLAPDTFYYAAGQLLRTADAGTLMLIAAGMTLAWRMGAKVPSGLRGHAALLSGLLLNQIWPTLARPSTGTVWRVENAAYLVVGCACAVGWISFASPISSSDRPTETLPAECR